MIQNFWKRFVPLAALALASCSMDTTGDDPPVHEETRAQAIGESSQAVLFTGTGAGDIPTYDERVATHLLNRIRIFADDFGITDMEGELVPPHPPMRYQQYFAEAGRWQGDHAIRYQCFCPQDPMQEPAAWNSCCPIGVEDGVAQCVGPISSCDDEDFSTEQRDRWALLNRGPGSIESELYWNGDLEGNDPVPGEIGAAFVVGNALGLILSPTNNAIGVAQVNAPVIPEECLEASEPCEVGTCTDGDTGATTCDTSTNAECLGLCVVEDSDEQAQPCTLNEEPDPEVCDPENLPKLFYWSYNPGRTTEPTPSLTDGIAYQLGFTATEENPNGTFGATPDGEVELAVHYYEPAGPPESAEVVVNGTCFGLEKLFEDDNQPGGEPDEPEMDAGVDGGEDMGMDEEDEDDVTKIYAGSTYLTTESLSEGCNRYFFSFIDGDGFVQRYPSLGSLGVRIGPDGNIVYNDSGCPAWSPEVPVEACLPTADECSDGDTRPCYTGRDGTQDKGICSVGVETCSDGRWQGSCEGEVRPEAEEICGNEVDDNCNGFVDEKCPVVVDPGNNDNNDNNDNNENNENNENNDNNDNNDNGDNGDDEDDDSDTDSSDDDGGCGCATTDGSPAPIAMFLIFLGMLRLTRSRG